MSNYETVPNLEVILRHAAQLEKSEKQRRFLRLLLVLSLLANLWMGAIFARRSKRSNRKTGSCAKLLRENPQKAPTGFVLPFVS